MVCPRGGGFTSKPSAWSKQGCLKPWFMTYVLSYAWRRDAKHNPRRSFWTVALCSRPPRAAGALGDLLALLVTPTNEQDSDQVQQLTPKVQVVTGETVEVAFV